MKNLAVIVPAYNEEVLIEKTINSIPEKVNKIVIINDCSKDDTEKIVRSLMKKNEKIELINFDKNSGVGAALIAGYNYCYEKKYDIAVVMPGDAQALPVDFDKLIEPVINGKADYAKGNRLKHKRNYAKAQIHWQHISYDTNKVCNRIFSYYGSTNGLYGIKCKNARKNKYSKFDKKIWLSRTITFSSKYGRCKSSRC